MENPHHITFGYSSHFPIYCWWFRYCKTMNLINVSMGSRNGARQTMTAPLSSNKVNISTFALKRSNPDSKVHGANMGPTWDRQDPGGPDVGPMKIAIWAFVESTLAIRTGNKTYFYNMTMPLTYSGFANNSPFAPQDKFTHDGCQWNQIFLYWGGIAWRSHQLSMHGVKRGLETFWNTGRVVGNPNKAVRGVWGSVLNITIMRIWREGTCSSEHKPDNDTCWVRTVPAKWKRYLQEFEIGWNSSDRSYFPFLFEIQPEHMIREMVCAHVTLEMCMMLLEHVHGWSSTQPNRLAHNLATHHQVAKNPAARWGAGSVLCVIRMGNHLHNLTSHTEM